MSGVRLVKIDGGPHEWNGLDAQTHKMIDFILQSNSRDYMIQALQEATASMPMAWYPENGFERGSKCPDDPLTVGVSFYEGAFRVEFSLFDEVREYIDDCRSDGSFSDGLGKIAQGFRALADEIDEAISEGKRNSD